MASGGVGGRGHCTDQRQATSVQKSNHHHKFLSDLIHLCLFLHSKSGSFIRMMLSDGIENRVLVNIIASRQRVNLLRPKAQRSA